MHYFNMLDIMAHYDFQAIVEFCYYGENKVGREQWLKIVLTKLTYPNMKIETKTMKVLMKLYKKSEKYISEIVSKRLYKIGYRAYLDTPLWEYTRYKTMYRDNFKCKVCGGVDNLNVHHLTYDHKGFERPKELITLCRSCHNKEHNK